jgi:flagellar protein FlaG
MEVFQMSIELINGPGKNVPTPVRVEFPAVREPIPGSREGSENEKEPTPDLSELSNWIADVQRNLNIMHDVNLNFSVHAASGRTIVTVTDEITGRVVREIPPREMLNLAVKLDEMMGLIFDAKA